MTAEQDVSYLGVVTIDLVAGTSGTVFPTGTASVPVDNLSDAFTIAGALGVRSFAVIFSDVVLDRAMVNWTVSGIGDSSFDVAGFNVGGSRFTDIDILGDFAASAAPNSILNSIVANVSNFQGFMENCGLASSISVKAGETVFVRCFSRIIGTGTAIVDCQDALVDIAFRGYSGGLEIRNFDKAGNNLSVDSAALRLLLGITVTAGDIVVRGTGEVEDATGILTSVDTTGFADTNRLRADSGVISELRKLGLNKMITDPITGLLSVFEDDGIVIAFQGNIFEDAAGLLAYRGRGAERREKLDLLNVFSDEFSQEFA